MPLATRTLVFALALWGGSVAADADEIAAAPSTTSSCGSILGGPPPADLYRALARGSADARGAAALAVLKGRDGHARAVIRRAIAAVAAHPYCPQLAPLTDTLKDPCLDDTTRASAALALGRIARDFPCTFPAGTCPPPHDPIPAFAKDALLHCAAQDQPPQLLSHACEHARERPANETRDARSLNTSPMIARACAEALGMVWTTDRSVLTALRDDRSRDTLLRIFAGRALSRLTGTRAVTQDSLDQLVLDAQRAVGP